MCLDNYIEILDYNGDGYNKTLSFQSWRVAFLNFAEKFRKNNFKYLEKHSCTDEVFVLLEGSAVLVLGKELEKVNLEKNKLYNVKMNVWHNIILEEESKVLIIENEDTSMENTEYFYI